MAMHNWFETKISYEKEVEGGMMKKVSESYLVYALSFTEAEAKIIKEMTPFMSGDFQVSNVGRRNYSEFFTDENGDYYFNAKVMFITIDEKSGAEKKSASMILVQADSFQHAIDNLNAGLRGTMADKIVSVTETKIMDVFPYVAPEEETKEELDYLIGAD